MSRKEVILTNVATLPKKRNNYVVPKLYRYWLVCLKEQKSFTEKNTDTWYRDIVAPIYLTFPSSFEMKF